MLTIVRPCVHFRHDWHDRIHFRSTPYTYLIKTTRKCLHRTAEVRVDEIQVVGQIYT